MNELILFCKLSKALYEGKATIHEIRELLDDEELRRFKVVHEALTEVRTINRKLNDRTILAHMAEAANQLDYCSAVLGRLNHNIAVFNALIEQSEADYDARMNELRECMSEQRMDKKGRIDMDAIYQASLDYLTGERQRFMHLGAELRKGLTDSRDSYAKEAKELNERIVRYSRVLRESRELGALTILGIIT
jgi:hypothetical protein